MEILLNAIVKNVEIMDAIEEVMVIEENEVMAIVEKEVMETAETEAMEMKEETEIMVIDLVERIMIAEIKVDAMVITANLSVESVVKNIDK